MDSDQPQSPNLDFFSIFNEKLLYDENTHSAVIAYFLGENKNGHRFPQYEAVLNKLLLEHFKIHNDLFRRMKFEDVKVTREFHVLQNQKRGRIDILVTIPVKSEKEFVLAIENKILSFEQGEQLHYYAEHVQGNYHPKSLLVLLSPKEIEVPNSEYIPFSYKEFAQILQTIFSDDEKVQAFITTYSLCLNQVSDHIPSKFQDYLAAVVKKTISNEQYSDCIKNISSYSNTWIDFEPREWDKEIKLKWGTSVPIPEDGIWGFSFCLSHAEGLSLEFYFRENERFSSFYNHVLELGQKHGIQGFRNLPYVIGRGKNKWVSIYSRTILNKDEFKGKAKLYSPATSRMILTDVIKDIEFHWKSCLKDFDGLKNILIVSKEDKSQ